MKKCLSIALSAVMAIALLAGCGNSDNASSDNASAGAGTTTESAQNTDGKVLNIGIIQYMQHASLDEAYQGFVDGLAEAGYVDGENITLNYQNASGEVGNCQSICDTFANGGWNAIEKDASEKADLLLSLGINVNLAPVCDVTSDYNAFMYDRSFSGDADEVSEFVKKVVEISGQKKLGTVLKHFPGYGNNEDTHTGIAYDNRDVQSLEETDFKPFTVGIESGADCVLVSHNIVNSIDSEYPASLSEEAHNILRNQLRFDGVIMTDDLSMGAITDYTGTENAAVLAIKSGNDLLCCSDVEKQYTAVLSSVQSGDTPIEQINNSVKRILKWKQKLGLIE